MFEDRESPRSRPVGGQLNQLARILAQCVYYLSAFFKLPADRREQVTFVVPTGNFGNVLAGWLVQRMGVPIKGFRVATNQNDILHRLATGNEQEVVAQVWHRRWISRSPPTLSASTCGGSGLCEGSCNHPGIQELRHLCV